MSDGSDYALFEHRLGCGCEVCELRRQRMRAVGTLVDTACKPFEAYRRSELPDEFWNTLDAIAELL